MTLCRFAICPYSHTIWCNNKKSGTGDAVRNVFSASSVSLFFMLCCHRLVWLNYQWLGKICRSRPVFIELKFHVRVLVALYQCMWGWHGNISFDCFLLPFRKEKGASFFSRCDHKRMHILSALICKLRYRFTIHQLYMNQQKRTKQEIFMHS